MTVAGASRVGAEAARCAAARRGRDRGRVGHGRGDPPRHRGARAGLPPATTSYFFSSIDDLLVEATRRFTSQQAAAYESLAAELVDAPPAEFAARFAAALMSADRIVELAQVEAYLHAAHDPAVRPGAAEVMAAFEQATIAALAAVGVVDSRHHARTFMAFVDGFILQHLANPRPDDEEMLRVGLDALFAAVTQASGARQ